MKTWSSDNLYPDVEVGDTVTKFGHNFQWTKYHLKGHQLEPLRRVGDVLADTALPFLGGKSSIQSTSRIELLEVSNNPNVIKLRDQVNKVPDWVDWDQIRRGQEVFWIHLPLCMMALLNASLVGGFGSPRITETLRCTAYLGRPDSAWPRLLETALMVQDVMSFGELKPGRRGWVSAINVRLMHSQVRVHILNLPKSRYDSNLSGIPINQEDLLSTLIVFSSTVLQCLIKMGIQLTQQQMVDYVAVWRYVGYLMGIDDTLGHFTSLTRVIALHQSVMMHLLDPDIGSVKIAQNVLEASANKAPFHRSYSESVAITRFLLGEEWADALELPKVPLASFFIPFRIFMTRAVVQTGILIGRERVMKASQNAVYFMIHRLLGQVKPNYYFVPIEQNSSLKSTKVAKTSAAFFEFINPLTLILVLALCLFAFSIVLSSFFFNLSSPFLYRLLH